MEINVSDLIQQAKDQKASDFQTAFNAIMLDKAAAAVEARRQEIAKSFFTPEQDEPEEKEEANTDENTETTA